MPACYFIPILRQNRHSIQRNIQAYVTYKLTHACTKTVTLHLTATVVYTCLKCTHLMFVSFNNTEPISMIFGKLYPESNSF